MDVTNEKLLRIAMEQSAVDVGCRAEDFERERNVVVLSREDPGARRYLELPFSCHLVSYGTNIVAAVGEAYRETVAAYIDRYPAEHCFETPNLHVLNDALEETGQRICFILQSPSQRGYLYPLPHGQAISGPGMKRPIGVR